MQTQFGTNFQMPPEIKDLLCDPQIRRECGLPGGERPWVME